MKNFVYKEREEKRLREIVVSSGFVTNEILDEIKKTYNNNPYHNFVHVLYVAKGVLDLSPDDFEIGEIYTLFYAALFHDAGHTGQADLLDEYNSLSIGLELLDNLSENYDLRLIDRTVFRNAIVGTVFKERGKLENKYSKILADLDICPIGESVYAFTYYSLLLGIEFGLDVNTWVNDYGFFKFTTSIEKDYFLTDEVKKIFPRVFTSMKDYIKMPEEVKIDMFETLVNEDITFEEFVLKYENSLQIA